MDSLAPTEPYTTEFEARIEERDGHEIVLDRTYFYPESGGQPADRGEIGGVAIVDVQKRDGQVIHTFADEDNLESGETVACSVDPAFRTYCMRTHTASHVLYGAGRRLLDDLGYGGFDIDERKARIDFETSTGIDDGVLVDLERLANRAVWASRPVSWETIPVDDARAREEVAFNTKTEEGVFGDGEGVRVVTIGDETAGSTTSSRDSAGQESAGPTAELWDSVDRRPTGPTTKSWDSAACGGTHVTNTREIGFISVLDRSNPGEGLTRVELAVGPTAIEQHAETRTAALSAARTLGVSPADLPEAVEHKQHEIAELRDERDDLLDRIADAQIAALREEIVECAGERWLVGVLSGVDGDTLANRARAMAGEECAVVALASDENPVTVAVASDGETDAGSVIEDLTAEFGGGGGGGPEFAQGGGIAADPKELVASLRSH